MRSRNVLVMVLVAANLGIAAEPAEAAEADALRETVAALCGPGMQGRAAGEEDCEAAAEWIAAAFTAAGLEPAGDDGGWFQTFVPDDPVLRAASLPLRNVVGRLPGTGDGCVVVGAHYDHLGIDEEGRVHPGADDNASGVAALIAIARELAGETPLPRNVVFAAFTGEEVGLLGSRHYVQDPACPLDGTIAMINLDTVGRMQERRLFAFATASARELPGTLRGVNLAFGFDLETPEEGPFASDQVPFLENEVPAVHLFTGPNPDYHRPSDTPEKLDYDSLAEIAAFTAETVRFLAERERGLTFVDPGRSAPAPAASPHARTTRKVSLGTIPDFADQAEGVLLSGVLPDSPAEKAGMRQGDRLVSFGGTPIRDLQDLTIALKESSPGDTVRVGFVRDGEEHGVEAVLVERR